MKAVHLLLTTLLLADLVWAQSDTAIVGTATDPSGNYSFNSAPGVEITHAQWAGSTSVSSTLVLISPVALEVGLRPGSRPPFQLRSGLVTNCATPDR